MNYPYEMPVVRNQILTAVVIIIYFLLGLAGILHHEMWLDEMHHWLIAKESHDVSELFTNMKYEGHPPVWNLILFSITRFTDHPFYMQLVHLILSTSACIIFFCYAPFSLLFKTGVVFGYFIFYEFSIISRNYAPGILLLWIICAMAAGNQRKYFILFLLSGLLANIHLFFLFISLSVFLVLVWEGAKEKKFLSMVPGITVYLTLVMIALLFIIPPGNHFLMHYNSDPLISFNRIARAGSVFVKAFLHVPDYSETGCWNTNLFSSRAGYFFSVPAMLFFFLPFIIFHRNVIPVFIFYFSSLCMAAFIYLSPLALGVRYFGMIYISFIAACWFQKKPERNPGFNYPLKTEMVLGKLSRLTEKPFFILLFSTQLISSAIIYAGDYSQPFSQAKSTALYLKQAGLEKKMITASNIAAVSSLSGFISKEIFSPEAGRNCRFSPWNVFPFQFTESQLVEKLKNIPLPGANDFVLISNHLLIFNRDQFNPALSYNDSEIKFLLVKSFTGSMVNTENYFIYRIQRKLPN